MFRLFAFALLLLPACGLAAGEREKARLEAVREQRTALERQLKKTEAARATAANRLRDTERDIAATVRKLRTISAEQALVQTELAARERALAQLEAQTAARQEQLGHLMRYQFRPQETADALAVLLAGGDPNAAARDRYFLALLSRVQADLIDTLRRDAAETRRLAAVVQERGAKLAELGQREEAERASLRQRQQERQVAVAKIADRIEVQRQEISTLRQNEQRLGKLIAALDKKAAQARAARSAKPDKSPPRGARPPPAQTVRAEPVGASGNFARLRGRLIQPTQGVVTGRFGARRADGQSIWRGLFIRATEGADVRAVAAGVVVFADWLRGYGNLLIIDHDDDFLSVYANNQALLAGVGQKVEAGRPVARVGTSGEQEESGLYFELRHRGQAFDPGKWLGTN